MRWAQRGVAGLRSVIEMEWLQYAGLACPAGILLFVALGLGGFALEQRAMRKLARRTACGRCGALLGEDALALADELWLRHLHTLRRDPDVKYRIVRELDAVCRACGQRHRYLREHKRFEPQQVVLVFERGD